MTTPSQRAPILYRRRCFINHLLTYLDDNKNHAMPRKLGSVDAALNLIWHCIHGMLLKCQLIWCHFTSEGIINPVPSGV